MLNRFQRYLKKSAICDNIAFFCLSVAVLEVLVLMDHVAPMLHVLLFVILEALLFVSVRNDT